MHIFPNLEIVTATNVGSMYLGLKFVLLGYVGELGGMVAIGGEAPKEAS